VTCGWWTWTQWLATSKAARGQPWWVSINPFNQGRAQLVILLPITSKNKGIAYHVPVAPPEGGLTKPSWIKCEDLRSVSVQRLVNHLGRG